MRTNAGFTLIELIMVIVILGVLSAVAIPKYMDLQVEARTAAADGVLGAAASACAINYAAVQTKNPSPAQITACDTLAAAITGSGVSIAAGAAAGECSFNVDNNTFTFSLTAETASAPCSVAKAPGKWPG